jgi:hypothetical protein
MKERERLRDQDVEDDERVKQQGHKEMTENSSARILKLKVEGRIYQLR